MVLKTLLAASGSNTLLDSISVPYFKIEYGGKSKIVIFCNEMNSEPKIITETNKVGKKYDRLTWGFTKVFNEPDRRGSLNINYHIIIRGPSPTLICELDKAPCFRFILLDSTTIPGFMQCGAFGEMSNPPKDSR